MVSKQVEAKNRQGYNPKPVHPSCSNCKHFTFDRESYEGWRGPYVEDKNLRCSLGGFKVVKGGLCTCHDMKEK